MAHRFESRISVADSGSNALREMFPLEFIRKTGYVLAMEKMALTFQSLSEEIRLRILALLVDTEELCVCDFMEVLQLPQSTVSRHLAHLKTAGWLRDRREGVWSYYALARPLPALQRELMPALEQFVCQDETAKADRDRLSKTAKRGHCA